MKGNVMNQLRTVIASLVILSCLAPSSTWATVYEWDGGAGDTIWDSLIFIPGAEFNWSPEGVPTFADDINLTAASVAGAVTIDLNGSRAVISITHNGVAGTYTFGDPNTADTITLHDVDLSSPLLNATAGHDLIINANIFLNTNNALLRFNSVNAGDNSGRVIVNGNVSPSPSATGTQTLELTSTNETGAPQIEVNGVISDGPGATLGLNAGVTSGSTAVTGDHAAEVAVTGLNTFTGPVRVTGGTLTFDSIENIGSPQANALGMPDPNAPDAGKIEVGFGVVTTGTLRFVGSDPNSSTSDRPIEINGLSGSGGAATIDASGSVPLVLSGGVTTPSNNTVRTLTLTGDSLQDNTISGVIAAAPSSGVLDVTKQGIGKWVLTANNTYDGHTRIQAGELVVSGPGAAIGTSGRFLDVDPSTTLTLDGGSITASALFVNSGATFNFKSGTASLSSGSILQEDVAIGTDPNAAGAGTLSITAGTHTFEGITISDDDDAMNVTGGTVNADTIDNLNGGTFTFDTPAVLNLTDSNSGLTTGTGSITGKLTGVGSVTKIGLGQLEIGSSTHDLTGKLNINEGSVQVTPGGRLSDGSIVNVASGATLRLLTTSTDAIFGLEGDGNVELGDAHLVLGNIDPPGNVGGVGTFSGTISDDPNASGQLSKRGTGSFTLAGQATYSGLTQLEEGTFNVTGTMNVGDNGVGIGVWLNTGAAGGGPTTLDIDGGTLTTTGNIKSEFGSGTIIIQNGGSVTATQIDLANGAGNYPGIFTWTDGTIRLTSASGLDVGVVAGANQPFQNSLDVVAGKTLVIDNTTEVGASGTLSISGGTLSTGDLDNTSSGSFDFNSGTLRFTKNQTFDAAFAAEADVNTPIQLGRTLEVTTEATVSTPLVLAGGTIRFGSVVNPGSLILDSGTFEVTASDLSVAATSIEANPGMTVNVTNGALNVASDGFYNAIGSSLSVANASTNEGQINAIGAGLEFTGGLTNNGDLNLINTLIVGSVVNTLTSSSTLVGSNSVSGDYTQAAGDALFIDLGGTLAGAFDTLTIGGDATLAGDLNVSLDPGFSLSPGDTFQIVDVTGSTSGTFNGPTLVGNFGGVPLFIDYGDGVALIAGLPGDFDFDNDVDGDDFLVWQIDPSVGSLSDWETNYGTVVPLSAASAAVPEPTTCTLALAALCLAVGRRRAF